LNQPLPFQLPSIFPAQPPWNTNSLLWESDGSKTFKVTANSDAEIGKTVKVTINAETEIHTTIAYSAIPLPDLPRIEVGTFQFDPIVESMDVRSEVGNLHVYVTDLEGNPISGVAVTSTLHPNDQPTLNGATDSDDGQILCGRS